MMINWPAAGALPVAFEFARSIELPLSFSLLTAPIAQRGYYRNAGLRAANVSSCFINYFHRHRVCYNAEKRISNNRAGFEGKRRVSQNDYK